MTDFPAHISDTEAMNRITDFVNQPGPVTGADLVDLVEIMIEATGRQVVH